MDARDLLLLPLVVDALFCLVFFFLFFVVVVVVGFFLFNVKSLTNSNHFSVL